MRRGVLTDTLPADLIAGVTVALVLIPQSIAYAALAGMPAEQGLYAAAFPPIVAALAASSPFLQTGPVALTCLLTFGALAGRAPVGSTEYVRLGLLLALVIGLVRLVVGLLGAGAIAYFISQPMLLGFVPAAAILICASQVPALTGTDDVRNGILAGAMHGALHPAVWSLSAVVFGGLAIATMIVLRSERVPIVAVVIIAAIVASEIFGYDGAVVGSLPGGLPSLNVDLPWEELPSLLLPAFVIALVGFAEPAVIARTYAAQHRQSWSANREFCSQGLGNITAAFTGGLPIGGSFSRTALNHRAGAKTRLSGAIAGAAVLLFLPFGALLARLPTAVLAAVVIVSVMGLLRFRPLLALAQRSRIQFALAVATFFMTLVLAPHVEWAIAIGVAIAIAIHLHRELRLTLDVRREGDGLRIRPAGVLWFGSAHVFEDRVISAIAKHPDARSVVLHLDGIGRLDITAAETLRQLGATLDRAGVTISLENVPLHAEKLVRQVADDLGIAWLPSSPPVMGAAP